MTPCKLPPIEPVLRFDLLLPAQWEQLVTPAQAKRFWGKLWRARVQIKNDYRLPRECRR